MKTYAPAPHNAIEVARWFTAWIDDEPSQPVITEPAMHCLLYYAQGHFLANNGTPLFEEEISAIEDEPQVVGLDLETLRVDDRLELDGDFDFADFTHDENQFLIQIWEAFGSAGSEELVAATSQTIRWMHCRSQADDDLILTHSVLEYCFPSATP